MLPTIRTVTDHQGGEQDPITAGLHALAEAVERDYGDRATMSRSDDEVRIAPAQGNGLPVGWADPEYGPLLYAEIGSHRFSVRRAAESVDYLADIVLAAVSGRISETRSVQRSCLFIPRGDGSVAREKGFGFPLGLVPLPGWTRWGSSTVYPAYEGKPA